MLKGDPATSADRFLGGILSVSESPFGGKEQPGDKRKVSPFPASRPSRVRVYNEDCKRLDFGKMAGPEFQGWWFAGVEQFLRCERWQFQIHD